MDITLHLPDDLVLRLRAEARVRQISVDQLATERLAESGESRDGPTGQEAIDPAKIMEVARRKAATPAEACDLGTVLEALRKNPAFADGEEAHRRLQELRDEWD